MDFDLGQRGERFQIDPLAGGCSWIELARNPRREVPEPIDLMLVGQQERGQPNGIEPLEGRSLQRSVVQVEPIDMDPRSHVHPRKKQGPLRGAALEPTACCRRVVGDTLHPFIRCPQTNCFVNEEFKVSPRCSAPRVRIPAGQVRCQPAAYEPASAHSVLWTPRPSAPSGRARCRDPAYAPAPMSRFPYLSTSARNPAWITVAESISSTMAGPSITPPPRHPGRSEARLADISHVDQPPGRVDSRTPRPRRTAKVNRLSKHACALGDVLRPR